MAWPPSALYYNLIYRKNFRPENVVHNVEIHVRKTQLLLRVIVLFVAEHLSDVGQIKEIFITNHEKGDTL